MSDTKTPRYHEHLREQRIAVCERFANSLQIVEAVCDDEDVLAVITFLRSRLVLAEPISCGDQWGLQLGTNQPDKVIGLCALLAEDTSLHPYFKDKINGGPTFSENGRTIYLPPDNHDLQDGVTAILLIHEGVHARASLDRQHERIGRDDPRHWEEELLAYRIEAKAARALNPTMTTMHC